MDYFDMLTPLGDLAPLAGVTLLSSIYATAPGYRIGFQDAEGKVPLLGDYRAVTFLASKAYSLLAPASWPLHEQAAIAADIAFSSLAVTEGMHAAQTGELWGMKIPSIASMPVIGKLLAPKDELAEIPTEPALQSIEQ